MASNKPLSDILVVALEQAVAAPYCSSRLADAGARVIKIERKEGDFARGYDDVVNGQSAYFVWLNRGKESVVLDIKEGEDKRILENIISKADVFIQNLGPGAAKRAGFDSKKLRKKYPGLITCDISGYSSDGPSREMKAYDMLVQAETGLSSVTGSPREPSRVGVSVCDIAAGMNAHAAILNAIIERKISGKGQAITCSLFDSMAEWMAVPLLHFDYGGKSPKRMGLRHPSIAPYSSFVTKDDKVIVISIQNDREWNKFVVRVLRTPELLEDKRFSSNISRVKNRKSLEKKISSYFLSKTSVQLSKLLRQNDIAYGYLNNVEGLSKHSDLRRTTVNTESGPVRIPSPPYRVLGSKNKLKGVPYCGEHTQIVREEFSK